MESRFLLSLSSGAERTDPGIPSGTRIPWVLPWSEANPVVTPEPPAIGPVLAPSQAVSDEPGPGGWWVEAVDSSLPLGTLPNAPIATEQLNESVEAHDTRATAQELPLAPRIEISGALQPRDQIDLYKIPVHPDTRTIQISLQVPHPSSLDSDRLLLFDASGHLIDNRPLPLPSGRLSVILHAGGISSDQPVFVGVSPASASSRFSATGSAPSVNPSSSSSLENQSTDSSGSGLVTLPGSTSYLLQVIRLDSVVTNPYSPINTTPSPWSTMSGDSGSSTPSSDGELVVEGTTVSPVTPTVNVTRSDGKSTASPPVGSNPPAIRPMPMRTTAPSGGVLSPGPATRTLNRREAAFVDLALIDFLPQDVAEIQGRPDGSPEGTSPTIPGRAPGGFPLLGAATPDVRTGIRSTMPRLPHRPATPSHRLSLQSDGTTSEPGTEVTTTPRSRGKGPRLALKAGLGFAYALAFTFLIPDLNAAFQAAFHRARPRLRRSLLRRAMGYWRVRKPR